MSMREMFHQIFDNLRETHGNGFFRFLLTLIAGIISLTLVLSVAFGSAYIVNEQESAVVVTLGTPEAVTSKGLHFKIPYLQEVTKVTMSISGMAIGYDPDTGTSIPYESLMITSDYNFVNVDFYLEYRVIDPVAYLYNAKNPETVLKTLAMSYFRDTIGVYPVDDVITTGKERIESEVKEKLSARLEKENIGLQVVNITIQDAEPPTQEVIAEFKAVENARQGADTAVNEAEKYRSEQIPAAEAKADQIIKQAEAEKVARINEANGQVSRFNAMYQEYAQYPEVTKERMYYEAMEELLPNMKVIIQDDNGNALNVFEHGDIFGSNAVPAQ